MEKLKEIICAVCINNKKDLPAEIDGNTRLREDLNFDSFDLAELTVLIEDAYGMDIFEGGIVRDVSEIASKLGIK